MAINKYEIDMTNGSMTKNIVAFALPLIASNILQLLYNAADIVVAGRFAGNEALAAVGSTGPLINLIVNLFIGLSIGTSVLVSLHYGAGNQERLAKAVHTSIVVSMIGGVVCGFVGIVFARPILQKMGTPDDVINGAVLYMQIYFIGAPASMFYNFGAAILRAVGDTKRPLFFLTVSGIINVILNLILVICFHLGVAGVAIATIVSQYLSAGMLAFCLLTSDTEYRLRLQALRLHKQELAQILKIGLPAGINNCTFSVSNMIIQSSVNSFGSTVMAGVTAAANLEGFVYTAMNAVSHATLTATSQNVGAGKAPRIYSSLRISSLFVVVVGLALGGLAVLLRYPLLHIYTTDPEVIRAGAERIIYVGGPYFLCGLMEVLTGHMRGLGYSLLPMAVSIAGVCGIRITWIYTVFAAYRTPPILYLSWAASWIFTVLVLYLAILLLRKKRIQKLIGEKATS